MSTASLTLVPAAPSRTTHPESLRQTAHTPHTTPDAAIDAALVRRFIGGDESAFVDIMQRHRGKIFSVVLGLLRNHADTEEVTQDTFIRAHRGLANFRGDSSLSTWLFRIATNLARNHYWFFFRRHRQDSLSLDCALSEDSAATFSDLVADVGQDPAQEAITGEFSTVVAACMKRLATPQRDILVLRNVLNHSYEEIAVALQIKVGTVKSRMARARENLRLLLAETCPEFSPDSALGEWFLPARAVYGRPAIACA